MTRIYPTIVSFYTASWTYEKYAEKMKAQCSSLGLQSYIKKYEDTGSWVENTRLKSRFIKQAMDELQCPILWVDVDGSILKTPDILKLPIEYDFMGRHQRTGPRRTWHVGTMFFNHTKPSRDLIDIWNEVSMACTGTDEASFEKVWLENYKALGIKYSELPVEYFEILKSESQQPDYKSVVAHRLSKCPSKMEMKKRKKT